MRVLLVLAGLVACVASLCTNNNKEYQTGETRLDDKGCNTCVACYQHGGSFPRKMAISFTVNDKRIAKTKSTCSENGEWACTLKLCTEPITEGGCLSNGLFYNEGESWQNDCNTCFCSIGNDGVGRVGCTLMECNVVQILPQIEEV